MAAPLYMRCSRCGRLTYCRDGLCDDCASYLGATGFRPFGNGRPKCTHCNGTGRIHSLFGPETPCPHCNGTGKA